MVGGYSFPLKTLLSLVVVAVILLTTCILSYNRFENTLGIDAVSM